MNIIPIYCVQTRDNEFIPFWELNYHHSEMYGDVYTVKGKGEYSSNEYFSLVQCYYDLKIHKILLGKIKDYYPKLGFKVGQKVLLEQSTCSKSLAFDKIKEIVFEEYESSIKKAKDMESYELKYYFTEDDQKLIDLKEVFEIRSWKPLYVMESGKRIEHYTQIYTVVNDED